MKIMIVLTKKTDVDFTNEDYEAYAEEEGLCFGNPGDFKEYKYEHDGVCPFSIIDGGECSHYSEESCRECFNNSKTDERERLSVMADIFGMESLTENEQAFVEGRISVEEFDANR